MINKWLPLPSLSLFKIISYCTFPLSSKKTDLINIRPIHRLCSLMRKMGAQSLRIEKNNPDIDDEINYEINYIKKFTKVKKYSAYRLFFVKEKITHQTKTDPSKLTFLSYSVIINCEYDNIQNSYLLFSVVATPKKYNLYKDKSVPLTNYYFHSTKKYNFNIKDLKFKFSIHGSPFFQKNGYTSFCIQTALATILNHTEDRRTLLLPNKINEMACLENNDILAGGLTNKQINDFISDKTTFNAKSLDFHEKGTAKLFKDLRQKFDLPPSAIIYPWMESGFPGFIDFKTRKKNVSHVVPILGHTLSTDRWNPEADIKYKRKVTYHFRPVSAWVDNFIIHDDNFGMYLCYPTVKFEETKKEKRKTEYLVEYVLFLTKEKIKDTPDKVEISSIEAIRKILNFNQHVKEEVNFWLHKLVNETNAPLVSRTLAADKSDYINCLKKVDSEKNKISDSSIKRISKHIPDKFWLTEISLPDLYTANRTVLVTVVSDLNTGEIKFFRFPKICALLRNNRIINTLYLHTASHFDLYTRSRSIETFDW